MIDNKPDIKIAFFILYICFLFVLFYYTRYGKTGVCFFLERQYKVLFWKNDILVLISTFNVGLDFDDGSSLRAG